MGAFTQTAAFLAVASLGACQCSFDASKLDRLGCTSTADCAADQECIAETCAQRGCHEASDCGDPVAFACTDGFCAATGGRDSGADGDADTDADADADADGDADPLDSGIVGVDASVDAGADAGSPGDACIGEEAPLGALYDDDDDPQTPDVDLLQIQYDCAVGCLDGAAGCIAECVRTATDAALSHACTFCIEDVATCAAGSCVGQCFGNPHAGECITCGCANCEAAFEACGGVVLPWCGN